MVVTEGFEVFTRSWRVSLDRHVKTLNYTTLILNKWQINNAISVVSQLKAPFRCIQEG
jgi:hypothetical protein